MGNQVSAGVVTNEIDLTTIVPTVSTTAGALAGLFRWGPVGELTLVSSEAVLASQYGKPTNFNAETWFTGANFLAYGNQLYISRAANTIDTSANGCWTAIADSSGSVANAVANGTYSGANVNTIYNVLNIDDFNNKLSLGDFAANPTYLYLAKYPGAIGSSLSISVCDTPAAFSSNLVNVSNTVFAFSGNTATINFGDAQSTIANATNVANLSSWAAWNDIIVGDWLQVGNSTIGYQNLQVASKGAAPVLVTLPGTLTSGSNTITALPSTAAITVGQIVATGVAGLANSTTVTAVINSTAVSISSAFSGSTAAANVAFASESLSVSFYSNYTLPVPVSMNGNITRYWQYYNSVSGSPATSPWQAQNGNPTTVDQVHVVVVDSLGQFTGTPGTILEVWQNLSRATDAMTPQGQTNFYKTVINNNSQYVWVANPRGGTSYTGPAATLTSLTALAYQDPLTIAFAGGQDGFNEQNIGSNIGTIFNAYNLFTNPEQVTISLIMAGKSDDINTTALGNYISQNICANRKDVVMFVSPNRSTVVSNLFPVNSVAQFRNGLVSTSYGVMDTGYKYQYDKYNDVYRYIPLNGDIAGLCVYTDNVADPWWSPAGFNRGVIKNCIKLAYNPAKADRDVLYPLGVNPVVTFPGQGTILYGDKTLQSQPSAFDRINVRRLFIVLEQSIALAAKYQLFQFNDQFTQAQFVSLVTPFLKDVQGRRGIYNFSVVCDGTNNTPAVVDANQFVGSILVQPAKSINYIQLNFVAVATGVDFTTVTGSF
jgi:hypothetical protein